MAFAASIVRFNLPDDILAATEWPFVANRMFMLSAIPGTKRGGHAHKKCSQFMVSINGTIDVLCENGPIEETFRLDSVVKGLWIPPMHWGEVKFITRSVLVVLCDRPYEADDYIRKYSEFVKMQ